MKTNVMRILDQKKIRYVIHTYQNAVSGIEVADTLNESYDKVFKLLYLIQIIIMFLLCLLIRN